MNISIRLIASVGKRAPQQLFQHGCGVNTLLSGELGINKIFETELSVESACQTELLVDRRRYVFSSVYIYFQ